MTWQLWFETHTLQQAERLQSLLGYALERKEIQTLRYAKKAIDAILVRKEPKLMYVPALEFILMHPEMLTSVTGDEQR